MILSSGDLDVDGTIDGINFTSANLLLTSGDQELTGDLTFTGALTFKDHVTINGTVDSVDLHALSTDSVTTGAIDQPIEGIYNSNYDLLVILKKGNTSF